MSRHRRNASTVVAVIAVACLSAICAPSAAAETDDERFADLVAQLQIPTNADDDLPAVGHRICDTLTSGLASNVNPVPTVRGVVSMLQSNGLSRRQAGGLMKASVAIYCPQHTAVMGH
jgi:Protein of unknown function (DUF732)